MVIQRWQSVWLLIAGILVIVFCCLPMAAVQTDVPDAAVSSVTLLRPVDVPVFMVVNILVAVLLFISIFLYRNMKRQKTATLVAMLLTALMMLTEIYILYSWNRDGVEVEWFGSIFLLLGALAFAFLAYKGISSDERLLKAADRLR
ncbi:MAG: DUF4293 domain-containing protein [Bacteroidales bacterium]|nr:DUF4293 domain-containing protein [Bacteroidales bacterium]